MLKVIYIDDAGNMTDMNAVHEGDYLVFETNLFSIHAIVIHTVNTGTVLLIISCSVASIVLINVIVFVSIKAKKRKANVKQK